MIEGIALGIFSFVMWMVKRSITKMDNAAQRRELAAEQAHAELKDEVRKVRRSVLAGRTEFRAYRAEHAQVHQTIQDRLNHR